MHHSGPLPLTFEGPEQGSGGKNCQNGSRRKLADLFASPSLNCNRISITHSPR